MSIPLRYKYHVLALAVVVLLLGMFAGVAKVAKTTPVTKAPRKAYGAKDMPSIKAQGQIDHSLELLPVRQSAILLVGNENSDLRPFILKKVKASLPKQHRRHAYKIARTVIAEANRHGMDPFFLLAVIATESKFDVKSRGLHGEIGLMQILPSTAAWLAPKAGIKKRRINLEDPVMNIRLGALYFAQLRERFDGHGTRYISAYNMGTTNVLRLIKVKKEPKIYSSAVLDNYRSLYADLKKPLPKATTVRRQFARAD